MAAMPIRARARVQTPSPAAAPGTGGTPPPRLGGGGGGRMVPEHMSMRDLMNYLLGATAAVPPSRAGPACMEIARTLNPTRGLTDSLLAGLFWWRFTHSQFFYLIFTRLGVSPAARSIIVNHANATRFNLLFLDPEYESERISSTVDQRDATYAMQNDHDASLNVTEQLLERIEIGVDPAVLLASGTELAQRLEFGVVLAQAPEEQDTCAVSPAVALTGVNNGIVATIGVILPSNNGYVATTANHALRGDIKKLAIRGRPIKVLKRHSASDSCLIALDQDLMQARRCLGIAGPLRGTPPPALADVFFDGAVSGPTKTRTHTYFDLSLLDVQSDELSRIYTDPDTVKGDSGAALIETREDHVLGFAHRRSAFKALIQYSSWVWAEQVYTVHNLYRFLPRHDFDATALRGDNGGLGQYLAQ